MNKIKLRTSDGDASSGSSEKSMDYVDEESTVQSSTNEVKRDSDNEKPGCYDYKVIHFTFISKANSHELTYSNYNII